ncbi:hypothetical protein M1105_17050 [Limibaculum sp. FT325]|uniref:phosphotransferase n=1 Tax=Thermohalobaculum sediminis TaxID=2939436 RepID=UPI0020BF9828|nr:hypothetical protein [Limibaculum sediminis]MCL5778688.1 hypothetical protein [Limibaculum sediminis]
MAGHFQDAGRRAPKPRAPRWVGEEPPIGVKVAVLSAPEIYSVAGPVEVRETSKAWVFLAADRAYKLKKQVRTSFLDYSTIEARRIICEEEVRLNRRLAPDVYRGVARLTVENGRGLVLDGNGPVVDWLVVMRRLRDSDMLDRAIATGTATPDRIEAVATRLAAFYRSLEPAEVDAAGHLARFAHELDENGRVLALQAFTSVAERGAAINAELVALLRDEPDLVKGRVIEGRVVEGHGDLRPEHVCLDDPPVVIDCLEFSRPLRLVDPFDELAYLGMECSVLGAASIGPALIRRCGEIMQDDPTPRLIAFYTAYRAMLRARQTLAHLLDPHPRTPRKWIPLANRYLDQAEQAALTLRPR